MAAFKPMNRGLVISGPFGVGKTRCLRAARRYLRDVMHSVWPAPWPAPPRYESVNWPDFVRGQVEDPHHGREAMRDLCDCDVVFLDDVGAEEDRYRSGGPSRLLGDVLGQLEGRFLFLTTNTAPMHWRARWDARVEDRLLRGTTVLDLWADGGAESYSKFMATR